MDGIDDKPLSRTEATLAADWLKSKKKDLKSGWISLWKVRPTKIAQEYGIALTALLEAIRRGS